MKKIWQSKAMRIVWVIAISLASMAVVLIASTSYVKHEVPVSLYGYQVFLSMWDKGYVVLEGTWVGEGEKLLNPLQVSKISCQADKKECIESLAYVSSFGSSDFLRSELEEYVIQRWDNNVLIYTTSKYCVDYIYTVNRDTKQVSGIRRLREGMEKICPEITKELKLRLTNGFDVYWKMEQDTMPHVVDITGAILILLWGGFRIRKILKTQAQDQSQ